jgi:ribonuclease R
MTRKKTQKKDKMKNSLTYIVSKVFEKNPNSVLSHKQVCALIDVREHELRKLVFSILEDLSKQGALNKHGHGIYGASAQNLIEGTIELTARGGGFVITDDEEKDIYIAPDNIGQALNGDRVNVRIIKRGKTRLEGVVSSVIQRDKTQFVGTIEEHTNFAFLVPDNLKSGTDIYIQKENLNGAKNGDKALVKITVWPKSSKNPYGEVVQVLGKPGSNDVEMISILCNHGIDYTFPQEVMEEAERVGLDLDKDEIKKRKDYRTITTFTIDPRDAKDFDDALSFQFLDNGNYEIGIHIADVSHYVQKDSAMDKEALKRSNSVYLVDRVIPMLPEQLSNLACSLRPNEDKFSFSAVFEISENGKIFKEWYGKTVIHSDRRFTYEEAQEILEGKSGDYEKELIILDKIAKLLRNKRIKNGALEIESEEMRFRLDDNGQPIEVEIKRSKDAHKLIEEFMLLANKKIASYIAKPKKGEHTIPFIYRIHDKPDLAKIGVFNVFIDKFGYKLDFTHPDQIASSINKLLTDIRLKNEHSIIQSMAIRSMAKASYDTDNIGHYGLAFPFYTHFTSPIRRYADLVVHRILQDELTQKKRIYNNDLNLICKRISKMEKRAVEAERESTKYFQTIFVADKKGEIFKGTVSGLADFGIFVKMDENHCEGMISLQNIPGDRFYFDVEKYRVLGSKYKREYNLGDAVMVKIVDVYPRKRQIELELISA